MQRDNEGMEGLDPTQTVILLAEDEPVVRNLVRTMLCQSGYKVLTANDGAEALQICAAFADEIHLLLTDVYMPLLDGLKASAAIRSRRPGIRVIVMSGNTLETIQTENRPDAFLRKPFIPPSLLQCVRNVLSSDGPVECDH